MSSEPLLPASNKLLRLSLGVPRPCPWGRCCICLNHQERRAMRRVGKIVRQWVRQQRRSGAIPRAGLNEIHKKVRRTFNWP